MPPRRDEDARLHAWASTGLAIVVAALAGGVYWVDHASASRDRGAGINLDEMEAIEASIAYRKATPQKQPQKKKRAPEPEVKPEGVSRDETKQVEPKKDEPSKKPDETDPDWKKFQRDNQDDEELDV